MTESITIRLSEGEIRELKRYGRVSDVVRRALKLYMQSERSREAMERLAELQETYKVRTTIDDDIRLIHEDRQR
jgi:Arc/MetJ-type ribon-helix-helix transcriptional regulator